MNDFNEFHFLNLKKELSEIAPKRIGIDVDGVLARDNDDKPYHERIPYPWIVELLTFLKEQGHYLIIHTSRYMYRVQGDRDKATEMGLQELKDWLTKYKIPYDEVYMGKIAVDVFIDDKSCRIESNNGLEEWKKLVPILKFNKKELKI